MRSFVRGAKTASMCLTHVIKNVLQSARILHWALVIVCAALIALALASETAQQYRSALHWISELSKVDLDKWAKMVENRQGVALSDFIVEPVLEQEAERARLPIKKGRIVWKQVAMRVHPSASEVRNATMETLLSSVFRNVETPKLFYPDEHSLRSRLRELFSEQVMDGTQRFVLSRALLVFERARDVPDKAYLRLEWYASADAVGVTPPAVTRDQPLDGAYKHEVYDFDHFIRDMNPELLKPSRAQTVVGEKQSWSAGVREQLSPIWGEIKDKALDIFLDQSP